MSAFIVQIPSVVVAENQRILQTRAAIAASSVTELYSQTEIVRALFANRKVASKSATAAMEAR
jgi:hypothetical protein